LPVSQIKAELIDYMGTDLTVVNAARVSFDKESEWNQYLEDHISFHKVVNTLKPKDKKLIHYLAKHKHLSPFGHCFTSFRITAPLFVARQLVKHEYLRMNEVSRRYVDSPPEFYIPDVWRGKADDRKQGSSEEEVTSLGYLGFTHQTPQARYDKYLQYSFDLYKDMIDSGVCAEQARMVLPQSMMTSWYWSGSMDAFANMCHLRCKEDTQYETRLVANQIDEIISGLYPVSWEALRAYAE
jgi:thymidylate synthase (FAD)